MLGNMFQESGLVSKALVAGLTFVRLVSLMTAGVGLQVGQLGEGLGAAWNRKRGVRKGSGRAELREGKFFFLSFLSSIGGE